MSKLSRTAQVVAMALFPFGTKSEVTFNTPGNIHEQTMEGLNELEAIGYIERDNDGWGAWTYKGLPPLGIPVKDQLWPQVTEEDSFPILKQEEQVEMEGYVGANTTEEDSKGSEGS